MKFFIFFLVSSLSVPTLALQYGTELDESQWVSESSPFVCRLEHHIEGYGTGSFIHHAGELRRLELDGQGILFSPSEVEVIAEPPTWRPKHLSTGLTKVGPENGEIQLDEKVSSEVATQLLNGMMVSFRGKLRNNKAQDLKVKLNTVGFRQAFDSFAVCEDGLLPGNFAQLERNRIQYKSGQLELDPGAKRLLNKIAKFLHVDTTVKQIFIDGHTDNAGRIKDNVAMSQQRAELVREQLVSLGVAPSMLVVRYHAEKYPVVNNKNAANRAKNRRTTIRLSRTYEEQIPAPRDEPAVEDTTAVATADGADAEAG